MGDVRTVDLVCETPMYAWGRYLFVAANVSEFLNLGEVEVFDGKLIALRAHTHARKHTHTKLRARATACIINDSKLVLCLRLSYSDERHCYLSFVFICHTLCFSLPDDLAYQHIFRKEV